MWAISWRIVPARPLVGGVGDPGPEHVALVERDAARVLHGPEVELGDEELVVLGERVRVAELGLEEVEALAGDGEDLVGVEVLGQRLPAVDRQPDAPVLLVDGVVRPGDEGDQVGRDAAGGLEPPPAALVVLGDRGVADDRPPLGGVDGQVERGLEVGLVEAGEDPVGVVGLELGVEVAVAVGGVVEAVQAHAGVLVGAVGHDPQLVVGGQAPAGGSGCGRRRRRRGGRASPLRVSSRTAAASRSTKVSAAGSVRLEAHGGRAGEGVAARR